MNTHLVPSLKKWKLDYEIEAIENLGSWYLNTGYKPMHILKMLKKHKQDVCFLDSDAVIVKFPGLLFEVSDDYDLACHMLDWHLHWRGISGQSKRELLSGTMVWKYKPNVLSLLERYVDECRKRPNVWEQKILQGILEKTNEYRIYELPADYCAVVNHNYQIPAYIKNPVIVHWQKSRNYKG